MTYRNWEDYYKAVGDLSRDPAPPSPRIAAAMLREIANNTGDHQPLEYNDRNALRDIARMLEEQQS